MKSWSVLVLVLVPALALGAGACTRTNGGTASPLALETQRARERLVLSASGVATLPAAVGGRETSGEIRFGGPHGRSALYLKFPNEWRARGLPLRAAFLTLSPRAGSVSQDAPVTLEAWRISADWQPQTVRRWSDKPSLALPHALTRLSATPTQDVRLDVTELVRFAAQNPEREFGIALIASGTPAAGAAFDTGFAGGRAPRLELYLR